MIRASYTAQGWDNYIHIVVSQLSLAKNMSEKSAWPLTLYHYAYLISINIRLETRDIHPLLTETSVTSHDFDKNFEISQNYWEKKI